MGISKGIATLKVSKYRVQNQQVEEKKSFDETLLAHFIKVSSLISAYLMAIFL
jgi:hypothetical protein